MTSILVAGVDSTVWTQSCPLSVLCSLGGRIYPRISYVWWIYSSFFIFLVWALLPALTKTGVEYFTNDPWSPNIFITYSYVIYSKRNSLINPFIISIWLSISYTSPPIKIIPLNSVYFHWDSESSLLSFELAPRIHPPQSISCAQTVH